MWSAQFSGKCAAALFPAPHLRSFGELVVLIAVSCCAAHALLADGAPFMLAGARDVLAAALAATLLLASRASWNLSKLCLQRRHSLIGLRRMWGHSIRRELCAIVLETGALTAAATLAALALLGATLFVSGGSVSAYAGFAQQGLAVALAAGLLVGAAQAWRTSAGAVRHLVSRDALQWNAGAALSGRSMPRPAMQLPVSSLLFMFIILAYERVHPHAEELAADEANGAPLPVAHARMADDLFDGVGASVPTHAASGSGSGTALPPEATLTSQRIAADANPIRLQETRTLLPVHAMSAFSGVGGQETALMQPDDDIASGIDFFAPEASVMPVPFPEMPAPLAGLPTWTNPQANAPLQLLLLGGLSSVPPDMLSGPPATPMEAASEEVQIVGTPQTIPAAAATATA